MNGYGFRLLVMRHGPAEALAAEHGRDADRRLTPEGHARTERACAALAQLLPPLECVYASPYLRAVETAELLATALEAEPPTITSLLTPGFERPRLVQMLADDGRPAAIVAHEPDLSEFIAWLSGARVEMDKGTACLTELTAPGTARLFAIYPLTALNNLDDNE